MPPPFIFAQPIGPTLGSSDGPTFTTPSATVTDISPVPEVIVRSAALAVGTRLRIRCYGNFLSTATSSSLSLGFYWTTPGSAITGGVALAVSPLWTWVSTSSANWPWFIEWEGEFRTLTTIAGGNTGTIKGQGSVLWPTSISAWSSPAPFPGTSPGSRTVSLDTSIDKLLSVGGLFTSIASGAPQLICEHLSAELLG